MSQVVATAEHVVHAPAEEVRAALADYEGARRRILPEQFSDYRVESGGAGAGTRGHWRVAAAPQATGGPRRPPSGSATSGWRSASRRPTPWSRPTPTPPWSPPGRCTPPTPEPPPCGCEPPGRAPAGSAASSSAPSRRRG